MVTTATIPVHQRLMHGIDLHPHTRLRGEWLAQEKLDGWRAVWDGSRFVSRQGRAFPAPDWLGEGLPNVELDGEFYLGPGRLQEMNALTRPDAPLWHEVRWVAFDLVGSSLPYLDRLDAVRSLLAGTPHEVAPVRPVDSLADLDLRAFQADGHEGYMLREGRAPYKAGRSISLLKFK